MHTPVCPRCEKHISPEDTNVTTDIAFCRSCNLTHWLSVLQTDAEMGAIDFSRPPKGAWFRREGHDTIIGVSYFSWPAAFGSLIPALFLNGIVWFLLFSFVQILLGRLGWWPGVEAQGMSFNDVSFAMLCLLILGFFIYGAGVMLKNFFLIVMGKTEICLQDAEARIQTKIGPLIHVQTVDLTEINDVWFEVSRSRYMREIRYDVMLGKQLGLRDKPFATLASMLVRPLSYFLTMAVRQNTRPRQIAAQGKS